MMPQLWLPCLVCLASAEPPAPLVLEPPRTDRALLNPGMGLYALSGARAPGSLADGAWWADIVDIAYFRPAWSDLEPTGPDDDQNAYFDPLFEDWVTRRGKRVAFRVMAESMHGRVRYVTPEWVFRAGVPGVEHIGLGDVQQLDPVFWDERYLDAACAFVQRMGRVLDGRPGLEYVDIGLIGEWGEMHLGLHIPGRWTPAQLEATGFTKAKYVAAYRRLIDAFAAAFPRTRVFLNVGDHGEINDYAALRGMHFRQDGLTPNGPSNNVGERFFKPYSDRGVLGNYEFHSGYEEMRRQGWDVPRTFEVGLSVPLSYLNTNLFGLGSLSRAPEEVRELFRDAARRIGYRFGLDRVETYAAGRVSPALPGRLPVALTWANRGLAPCPLSCAVELALLVDGRPVALVRDYPDPPTTRWAPGGQARQAVALELPAGTPPGRSDLAVRMILPEAGEQVIALDLADRLEGGWYRLSPLPLELSTAAGGNIYDNGFETDDGGFAPAPGMTAARRRQGEGWVLGLTGSQGDGWGLGSVRVPVRGAARYRLTVRLRVLALEPARGIYFKAGLNRADGSWVTNFNTNRYDVARRGEWQTLTVAFDTPADATTADLALEKGGRTPLTAEVELDDLTLELLTAP